MEKVMNTDAKVTKENVRKRSVKNTARNQE